MDLYRGLLCSCKYVALQIKVLRVVIIVLNTIFIYSFNKYQEEPGAHDARIRKTQLFNEYRVLFWRNENVLELEGGGGCTTL